MTSVDIWSRRRRNTAALLHAALVAVIVATPVAHADIGDQSDAEQAVTAIYNKVIPGCTSGHNVGNIQSITWDRFYEGSGGSGRIEDANSSLGGPFEVVYWNPRIGAAQDSPPFRASGQWGVDLQFC